jgi:hypothetical protein
VEGMRRRRRRQDEGRSWGGGGQTRPAGRRRPKRSSSHRRRRRTDLCLAKPKVILSHACTRQELHQACTTGNASYLRFPLCSSYRTFCTAKAWLSSCAGYQTPANCTTQAWIAHMQLTKRPCSSGRHDTQRWNAGKSCADRSKLQTAIGFRCC